MTHHKSKYANSRRAGFVLIEALIALLLISVGLLAVSRLQVLSISGSGEAKQYSSAMAISQRKLEDLRNILLRSQFAIADGTEAVIPLSGDNATYNLAWTVTPNPVLATTEQLVLRLTTTWTDRNNVVKSIDLNSVIAWDDPGARRIPPGCGDQSVAGLAYPVSTYSASTRPLSSADLKDPIW